MKPSAAGRMKAAAWRAAFARWPPAGEAVAGYTLLLPVPADLPVFLELALANAAKQDPAGRIETLVVPDAPSASFAAAFEAARSRAAVGPLRLVEPGARARIMRRAARNAISSNHFIQLHAGLGATRSTHALLHDADLFIEDPGFMARHYRNCATRRLACLGVSPAWDEWMREHGFGHVVATWELMVDTSWVRSFSPWQHRPRVDRIAGERHVFDTMLYTQALTAPERCGLDAATEGFEHFNWVIGVYRGFQRAAGRPFEDDRFLLVLIRLLSDEFGVAPGIVPPVQELALGIENSRARVTYRERDTPRKYGEFRAKLDRVLAGPLFGAQASQRFAAELAPFERAFGA